jgi:hypothetical protein
MRSLFAKLISQEGDKRAQSNPIAVSLPAQERPQRDEEYWTTHNNLGTMGSRTS